MACVCVLRVSSGVCPIAEFSQTLTAKVSPASAACFYLTNRSLSAVEALKIGLADEVCQGVWVAQRRALQVAAIFIPIDMSDQIASTTMLL